jgi:transposase InsO family protein
MKAIATVLGVARSNLAECRKGTTPPRGPFAKVQDDTLLPVIRGSVDQRPTYGYRRIAALLNRERAKAGQPPINRKRVHRIMQRHAMLLEPGTGRREGRIHDGKVMVMRSNLRRCSDGLEFACWNGDVIRMTFIIDAFDSEIIAWCAVSEGGISGSDVRDMMLAAVESRFGTARAPHQIEQLSDNGSPYTAKETRDFATALNLVPCFTPVRSPESNSMSEAFVKTFKRDYLRINPLPDAPAALRQIAGWVADYNETHPHSPLRMRSPRAFIRAQAP